VSTTQVVSAIRGPQSRSFTSIEFFAGRVDDCAGLGNGVKARYFDTLTEELVESTRSDVLEALCLLCLGCQDEAQARQIDIVELLLRAAGSLEREHEVGRAHALLSVGWQRLEQPAALLRAMEHFRMRQRRQTRHIADLLAKADLLWKRSEIKRAEEALGEVLEIDPRHETALGMVRAIRAKRSEQHRQLRQRFGLLVAAGVIFGVVSLAFSYEGRARDAYRGLPVANPDELSSVTQRLSELESFMDRYPVWIGSFQAVEERAQLRVQAHLLERRQVAEAERHARQSNSRLREAEFAYREGRRLVEIQELEAAAEQFRVALEMGSGEWERQERAQADLAAIEDLLNAEEPQQ
jgi:tetratricopeptide (TPR) repeat protein